MICHSLNVLLVFQGSNALDVCPVTFKFSFRTTETHTTEAMKGAVFRWEWYSPEIQQLSHLKPFSDEYPMAGISGVFIRGISSFLGEPCGCNWFWLDLFLWFSCCLIAVIRFFQHEFVWLITIYVDVPTLFWIRPKTTFPKNHSNKQPVHMFTSRARSQFAVAAAQEKKKEEGTQCLWKVLLVKGMIKLEDLSQYSKV